MHANETPELDTLISLADAARKLPTRPHLSVIWRWATSGLYGSRLQSWSVGKKLFTTESALKEFVAATTRARAERFVTTHSLRPRRTRKVAEGEARHHRADAELAARGL